MTFSRELRGEFNREEVHYRAVAGETYIRDEQGVPVASLFTIAYLKSGCGNDCTRPVTFVFNGGPGSSAQWLHMGAFGPKRVDVGNKPRNVGAPPYALVENAQSILDVTDLVFIDPIGTGYSRALGDKDPKDYWGVLEDARSFADFIQTWITNNCRWNSPKYLAGESYGTTRACILAGMLSDRYIALNGIILIAAVLDYQNSRPRAGDGGILSYASFLPTYAAIAWYHKKIRRVGLTLNNLLDEVRLFARTEYAQALIANEHRLTAQQRREVVARMAGYTGLKESYIEQSRLRVPVDRFFKELLRDESMTIGRLDGRYTAREPECAGESAESDPTLDAISGAFTSATQTQLSELGVRMERPYLAWTRSIIDKWNWQMQSQTPNGGGYINVVSHLGRSMRNNKDLRVFVALGYYDLATPFFGAENALSQDGLVHQRITFAFYEAGHMIFLHEPSRIGFLDDVGKFITDGRATAHESA